MIVNASNLADKLRSYYDHGLPSGSKTGWPSVDSLYTVLPGQMTIVTGIPAHGKSEWLDALMVNLAPAWQFCIFSPENFPHELHISKLIEKMHGKPFTVGVHDRIKVSELISGVDKIDASFGFFRPAPDLQVPDMGSILDEAGVWFEKRPQKRGLVIDPWNELEHRRPQGISETEYISQTLSEVRQWAREFEVHVFIVAHPMKLQKDQKTGNYPVPTPYDISGSAHWRNKADNCIAIWRDVEADNGRVQVHVQKIRFKNLGKPGLVELKYDKITGRYSEIPSVVAIDKYRRASGGDD